MPAPPAPTSPTLAPLADDARDFAALTFPAFRRFLEQPPEQARAIGARLDGEPVGLALVMGARLLSLAVRRDRRGAGIGRRLAEAAVAAAGGGRLHARWSSLLPGRAAFEAVLARGGWSAPEVKAIRASGTAGAVLRWAEPHAPALRVLRDYSLTPWPEATDADRAHVELLAQDGPPGFSPAAMEREFTIWGGNSWLLRRAGEPVGWMLTRRIEDGTVWYHGSWTRPDLAKFGPMLMIFLKVHQVAAAELGPDSRWRIDTAPRTPGMMAFMRRRVTEFADFQDEYLAAVHPGTAP